MTQWNEILTNTGWYRLLGTGGQDFPGIPGAKYVLCQGAYPDRPALVVGAPGAATNTKYEFVESEGGRLSVRETSTGKFLLYYGVYFTRSDTGATHFVPDEIGGNVVLRFEDGAQTKFLAMGSGAQGGWYDLVASSDPNDPNQGVLAQWQLAEQPVPNPYTPLQRWLHTYVPENRFSPMAFLMHVRRVVSGDDPVHNDPDYLAGLTAPVNQSIRTKVDNWTMHFAAATALQRAEANGAMLLASSHFYNHPTSEWNELDPKRPPEWSEVDDALGGDPYPG